jgi:hypothetical protein
MRFWEVAVELGCDIVGPGARPAATVSGLHRPPVFAEPGKGFGFGPVAVTVETPDG